MWDGYLDTTLPVFHVFNSKGTVDTPCCLSRSELRAFKVAKSALRYTIEGNGGVKGMAIQGGRYLRADRQK